MGATHTPHSCMRLSKSSVNGPDTIVPSSCSFSSSSFSVVMSEKMMIPSSVMMGRWSAVISFIIVTCSPC